MQNVQMDSLLEAERKREGEKRAQAVNDFLASLDAQREALGAAPKPGYVLTDEELDELRYEAYMERMAERGLL